MLGLNADGHGRVGWRGWLGVGLVLSAILIWIPHAFYTAVSGFVLVQWRALLTGLAIVGLAGIAGSTVVARKRPAQETGPDDEAKPLLREIPGWAIWAGMAGLVIVGLISTWWLVTTYGGGDAKTLEQNRLKLEAIKLAGSVVVGTGGVAALLLAARRQRVSELDLLQRDRIADANCHDADERRATELYTAAAEQLASDKAPVRMAGMYALSRLGEANEDLRQTIINLLCAYLRMPDISVSEGTSSSTTAPDSQEDDEALEWHGNSQQAIVLDLAYAPLAALTSLIPDQSAQQKQERQVRLTAQRLLAHHLRPVRGDDGEPTSRSYWPDMDIDLSDANLHELDFAGCEVRSADFRGADFDGPTWFNKARFKEAQFHRAQFHNYTWFDAVHFGDNAAFYEAQFYGYTSFTEVNFKGTAGFGRVQFNGMTTFYDAHFHGESHFDGSRFHDATWLSHVHFHHIVTFAQARFHRAIVFNGTHFYAFTSFDEAQFLGEISFDGVQFHTITRLGDSSFSEQPTFSDALVRIDPEVPEILNPELLEEFEIVFPKESAWPRGWTVRPVDLNEIREGRWGKLVLAEPGDLRSFDRHSEA